MQRQPDEAGACTKVNGDIGLPTAERSLCVARCLTLARVYGIKLKGAVGLNDSLVDSLTARGDIMSTFYVMICLCGAWNGLDADERRETKALHDCWHSRLGLDKSRTLRKARPAFERKTDATAGRFADVVGAIADVLSSGRSISQAQIDDMLRARG